jgi:hypothetical protein
MPKEPLQDKKKPVDKVFLIKPIPAGSQLTVEELKKHFGPGVPKPAPEQKPE